MWGGELCFLEFANFHGINPDTTADFKLLKAELGKRDNTGSFGRQGLE